LASTLDVVRRSVEQLAARQEQMAQNIAALRAVERTPDTRRLVSASGPGPAGRLDPAAQTSASQDRISPAASPPDHSSRADGPAGRSHRRCPHLTRCASILRAQRPLRLRWISCSRRAGIAPAEGGG
jgi:hypothetical protein